MKTPKGHAVVIGASNLDIKGHTASYHVAKTSNPGIVSTTAGGVGRNIAENLARMGSEAILLSAVGNDMYGRQILDITGKAGVNLEHIIISQEQRTGIFLALLDHYGDLVSAISDLDIIKILTPEYINQNIDILESSAFVILDADVPTRTLQFCLRKCREKNIPACVEPISVAKAKQIIPYLDQISMVTPNREEAEVLAGFPLRSGADIRRAGEVLLDKGIKYVIITLGPEGALIASLDENGQKQIEFLPSISTVVTDTVGAGDALTSGTICGLMSGLSFKKSVERGILCATLTLQTNKAVNPELSLERLEQLKKGVSAPY